jgi:hypothetical protein
MIVTAFEYEKAQPHVQLQSFYNSTNGYFKHPQMVALADALHRKREAEIRRTAA